MSNQLTLAYTVNVAGTSYGPAKAAIALEAVPLYANPTNDPVLGQLFGITVASDVTTTPSASTATRTIVLNMTSAVGAPTAPPAFPCNPITATPPVLEDASFTYINETGLFAAGDVVTGGTSGATATVAEVDDNGSHAGTLFFVDGSVTGAFRAGETLAAAPSGAIGKVGSLVYTSETGLFVAGDTVTGGTSHATGVVVEVEDNGSGAGTLFFNATAGVFTIGETLTGSLSGATATGGSPVVPPSYYSLWTTKPLPGSFLTTPGSYVVATSDSQVPSLVVNATVQFLAQPGVFYAVKNIFAGSISIAPPYTGPFSEDDGAVEMIAAPAKIVAVYSTSPLDSNGLGAPALPQGSGAQKVSLSYKDSNGGAHTLVASLLGTYPLRVTLPAFPAAGFDIAVITDVHVSQVGGFGNSVGQITLCELASAPPAIPTDADSTKLQTLNDQVQMLISRGLVYLPPSYFALAQQGASTQGQSPLLGEFLLPGKDTVELASPLTPGGTSVATTVDQTSALATTNFIEFAAQPGVPYKVLAVSGNGSRGVITLATPWTGLNDNPILSSATLVSPSPAAEPTNAQLSGAVAEFVNPGTAVPPPNRPLAPQTMSPSPTFLSGMFGRVLQLALAVPVVPTAIVLS